MATPNEHEYMDGVLEHKRLVGKYIRRFVGDMVDRAVVHDYSKFGPEEFEPYAGNQERFKTAEYGSEEYRAACEAIKPAIEHHVTHNTHHPEYYQDGVNGFRGGINDMDLFDIVEMVCDWCAACQRANGTTLRLDLQKKRFGISDQLYGMIVETAFTLLGGEGIEIIYESAEAEESV